MEIKDYWRVTQIIRDIPEDRGFSTSLINQLLQALFQITRNASLTIGLMNCVEKVHSGSFGESGESRNSNIYRKQKHPENFCSDCKLDTCMIRNKRMAIQIGLDQEIPIPAHRLIELEDLQGVSS